MSQRAISMFVTLALVLAAGSALAQAGDEAPAADAAPAEATAADGEAPPADVGPVVEPREAWEAPPKDEEPAKPEVAKPQKEKVSGDGVPASVGLLLGWGFKTDKRTAQLGADPYGLGLGLRGGYALDFSLYLGGYFVYYIGSSETGSNALFASGVRETHANYVLFGVEVGYDWWIGDAIVRPSLQLGPALALSDATGSTESTGDLSLHPGMSVLVPFADWYIGGDFRPTIVTGDGVSGVALFVDGGMRFGK